MNLLSPLFEFSVASPSNNAGKLRVYYSKTRSASGSSINTLAYAADVVSVDGTYRIDLVRILSSYFHPRYVSGEDMYNVLKYRVTFEKVGGSEATVSSGEGTFYYSDSDGMGRSYVKKYFGAYSFPITKAESVVVVKDGISTTYSDSGSKLQIISAPTSTLTIGGETFVKKSCDADYQIDYINEHGVWSFYLPDGNCYRTDNVQSSDAIRLVRYGSEVRKLHSSYKHVVTPQFVINTSWISEGESEVLVHGLLESPYLVLHTPNYVDGFPVKVVDGSFSYLDPHKDTVMNYQFVLESLVPLVKY